MKTNFKKLLFITFLSLNLVCTFSTNIYAMTIDNVVEIINEIAAKDNTSFPSIKDTKAKLNIIKETSSKDEYFEGLIKIKCSLESILLTFNKFFEKLDKQLAQISLLTNYSQRVEYKEYMKQYTDYANKRAGFYQIYKFIKKEILNIRQKHNLKKSAIITGAIVGGALVLSGAISAGAIYLNSIIVPPTICPTCATCPTCEKCVKYEKCQICPPKVTCPTCAECKACPPQITCPGCPKQQNNFFGSIFNPTQSLKSKMGR